MIDVTILFDNTSLKEDLVPLWGFSAFVSINGKPNILFDTGSNGRILLKNARKLNVDFKDIDFLFVSHPHWDHTGGIDTVLEENPDVELILPASLSRHWIADLQKMARKTTVVDEKPLEIAPGIYSQGIMADEGEQALMIETAQGWMIFTGCGHQGVLNILSRALKIKKLPVVLLAGGLHLLHKPVEEIKNIVRKTDVNFVCPTHCTGETAINEYKLTFGKRYIPGGVGAHFVL